MRVAAASRRRAARSQIGRRSLWGLLIS